MQKTGFFLLLVIFLPLLSFGQDVQAEYLKNLDLAADTFLRKEPIPDAVLLKLVPEDDEQFSLYYETTYPDHRMNGTGFFYHSSRAIFEKALQSKNQNFYVPSLQLISFADGEYAELFLEYLDRIVEQDKKKFCETVRTKHYISQNPMKYYWETLCQ